MSIRRTEQQFFPPTHTQSADTKGNTATKPDGAATGPSAPPAGKFTPNAQPARPPSASSDFSTTPAQPKGVRVTDLTAIPRAQLPRANQDFGRVADKQVQSIAERHAPHHLGEASLLGLADSKADDGKVGFGEAATMYSLLEEMVAGKLNVPDEWKAQAQQLLDQTDIKGLTEQFMERAAMQSVAEEADKSGTPNGFVTRGEVEALIHAKSQAIASGAADPRGELPQQKAFLEKLLAGPIAEQERLTAGDAFRRENKAAAVDFGGTKPADADVLRTFQLPRMNEGSRTAHVAYVLKSDPSKMIVEERGAGVAAHSRWSKPLPVE